MKRTTPKLVKNNHALRRLRRSFGYDSAEELANKIGVSKSTYARYERYGGTTIPTHTAWQIADIFGCTIDEVVGRIEPNTIPLIKYEQLSDKSKSELKEYIEYLECRDKVDEWKNKHEE